MFRSILDTLPVEIILLIVDNFGPKDLQLLLHCIHWLPEILESQQIANKDEKGNTILHLLAKNGEADLIYPLLLKDRVNPDPRNSNGETPLFCAVLNGHKETIKFLLMGDGVNPNLINTRGCTPLI
jgi:ankyrin repeat protein